MKRLAAGVCLTLLGLVACGDGGGNKSTGATTTTWSAARCVELVQAIQSGQRVVTDAVYEERCGRIPRGLVLEATSTTTTTAPIATTSTTSLATAAALYCADVERVYQDEVLSQDARLVADANSLVDRLGALAPSMDLSNIQTLRDGVNKGTFSAGIIVTQIRKTICNQ